MKSDAVFGGFTFYDLRLYESVCEYNINTVFIQYVAYANKRSSLEKYMSC